MQCCFAESPLVNPSFDLEVGQLQKVIGSLRRRTGKTARCGGSLTGDALPTLVRHHGSRSCCCKSGVRADQRLSKASFGWG